MRGTILMAVMMAGCTFPQVVPEARDTPYVATGGLQANRFGATFDAVRVRAPHTNLSKRTDGSWAGTLNDGAIDTTVTEDSVRGVGVLLTRKVTAEGVVILGQVQGQILRFELGPDRVRVRTPQWSFDFDGRAAAEGGMAWGPRQDLVLTGEAADPATAPWPQLGLALAAAFL